MLRVGLTGSIASGKSFVAATLGALGCFVLDADQVARDVVVPGSEGLNSIIKVFGVQVLTSEGDLDRAKMGALVFENAEARATLNNILHPLIIAAQERQLESWQKNYPEGIAVVEASLIIEAGARERFQKLIVAWCEREAQIERLCRRNGVSREEAEKMIAAQMTQEEKKRFADYLIDTNGTFQETKWLTEEVYEQLKQLV